MMAQAAKPRTSAKAVRIALLDLGRLISVRRKSSVRSLGLIPDCFTLVSVIVGRFARQLTGSFDTRNCACSSGKIRPNIQDLAQYVNNSRRNARLRSRLTRISVYMRSVRAILVDTRLKHQRQYR